MQRSILALVFTPILFALPSPILSQSSSPSAAPSPQAESSLSSSRRFVYEALESNDVQGFSINPTTGELTPLAQGPVKAGKGFTQWVAADRVGGFLFVSAPSANAMGFQIGQDVLAGFRIDKDTGTLTPVPGSPVVLHSTAGAIAVSPDGKFLYMSTNGVDVYSIDRITGALKLVRGSPFVPPGSSNLVPFGSGLAISPSGRFLYQPQEMLGHETDEGQVAVFSLDPKTGVPSHVKGSPFSIVNDFFPSPIFADPHGRFVYTGGGIENRPDIDVKRAHSNGELTDVPGSPFMAGSPVNVIVADPSGKFLYLGAGVAFNAGIYALSIDPVSGALTPVPGSPFALGTDVGGLAVDQSGRFLYLGTFGLPPGFNIDPSTGTLTPFLSNPPGLSGFENGITTVEF